MLGDDLNDPFSARIRSHIDHLGTWKLNGRNLTVSISCVEEEPIYEDDSIWLLELRGYNLITRRRRIKICQLNVWEDPKSNMAEVERWYMKV